MKDLHLEIPLLIFVTGCIIYFLSVLGFFSLSTTEALSDIGAKIGLLGVIAGIIVCVWDK